MIRRTCFRSYLAAGVLFAGVALVAWVADSRTALPEERRVPCTTEQKMHKTLTEDYGEFLQAIGIVNDTTMMRVYASEEGTWTSVMVSANGKACMIAAGKHFSLRSKPIAGSDA